jgi:hypothetical protein
MLRWASRLLKHGHDRPAFLHHERFGASEKHLNRLLSCVGMAKISEWFLLLLSLATMASIDAEDPRLARNGGQARTVGVYALLRAVRARSLLVSPQHEKFLS